MHWVPSAARLAGGVVRARDCAQAPKHGKERQACIMERSEQRLYAHTPQCRGSRRHVHGRGAVRRSGKLEAAWPWRLRRSRRRRSQLHRQPARVIIFCMATPLWVSAAAFCKSYEHSKENYRWGRSILLAKPTVQQRVAWRGTLRNAGHAKNLQVDALAARLGCRHPAATRALGLSGAAVQTHPRSKVYWRVPQLASVPRLVKCCISATPLCQRNPRK